MSTEVLLPQWGMSMHEGTVVAWLKQPGDAVVEGEDLLEVETEKVNNLIVAPASGTLGSILVPEGETVEVYAVLGVILAPDELDATTTEAPLSALPAPAAAPPPAITFAAGPRSEVQVEPRARRLARELGVDVDGLVGTGPNGRIVEADVVAATRGAATQPRAVVSLTKAVDATAIVRRRLDPTCTSTYLDFFLAALGHTLVAHPSFHTSDAVDIGVVSWDDDDRELLPVVRNVPSLSLVAITDAGRDLATRIRESRLSPDDQAGSTFDVTNFGRLDIDVGTPALRDSQRAALGIGRVTDMPAFGTAWATNVEHLVNVTLVFDANANSTPAAARFLHDLAEQIERPGD